MVLRLLDKPVESCVIPSATPTAIRVITTGPREGSINQPDAEMYAKTAAVVAVAAENVMSKRFFSPPRTPIQKTPAARLKPIKKGGVMVGLAKKSLKPIAPNCLSKTATQKIGRE